MITELANTFMSSSIFKNKQFSLPPGSIPVQYERSLWKRKVTKRISSPFFVMTMILLLAITSCGMPSGSDGSAQAPKGSTTVNVYPSPINTPSETDGSTPVSPTQQPTASAPTNVPITPTQDPNAPVLMIGSGQLVDTCLKQTPQTCDITFGLAKSGTQDIGGNWPNTVHWNVTSSVPGIVVDQPTGTFNPSSDSIVTHVTTIPSPCQPAIITINTTDVKIEKNVIPFLCDPGLALSLADNTSFPINGLSQNTPGCSLQAASVRLTCTITLKRTSNFQGDVNWNATSSNDVQIQPSSSPITPDQPIQITISNIYCNTSSGGSVNFEWSENVGSPVTDTSAFSWTNTVCS